MVKKFKRRLSKGEVEKILLDVINDTIDESIDFRYNNMKVKIMVGDAPFLN